MPEPALDVGGNDPWTDARLWPAGPDEDEQLRQAIRFLEGPTLAIADNLVESIAQETLAKLPGKSRDRYLRRRWRRVIAVSQRISGLS